VDLGRKWPMSSALTEMTFWLCGSGYSPAHRGKPSTTFVIAAQPLWVAMCSITIAGIAPSLTIRVLWGVFSNGEFGPGIDAEWAVSTVLGGRRLTINSGASATLMQPFMAIAQ